MAVISRGKSWGSRRTTAGIREAWHRGCNLFLLMGELFLKVRPLRRFWQFLERLPPFFVAVFSKDGLISPEGRILIAGKARRIFISFFPPLAAYLQKRYGLVGGCRGCGASCRLLFQCPHYDESSGNCSVYEDRPNICRFFPITPSDVKERDLVSKKHPCGFQFVSPAGERETAPVSVKTVKT